MAQVGSTCYDTDDAALAAIASAEVGKVVPAGSVVYVVDAAPAGASGIAYTLTPVGGGSAISVTSGVTLPACQLLSAADGLQLGWLVAAAWIIPAALLFIRRALVSRADPVEE